MALDPRLQRLGDLLVVIAARELQMKNAIGAGKQSDSVEVQACEDYHVNDAPIVRVVTSAASP